MWGRLRTDRTWWLAALAGAAALCWLGLPGFAWTDYDHEVAGAFRALIDGDVRGFLVQAPAYGGSLVLRAPFAAVTALLGGGELAVYRAVAIPCVLAGVMLAMALVRRLDERGAPRGTRAIVLGLCAVNPVTLRALEIGHPEEVLAAAFAIGAVLGAARERPLLAGALLGLAVGTKLWAVLAVGPVLLALPGGRVRALTVAGGVVALVMAPLLLANPGHSETLVVGAGQTGTIFQPWQVFWPLGDTGHLILGTDGQPKVDYRLAPAWLSPLSHPLIAGLGVPLSLLWWRRHGAGGGERVLLLLALLLLARCLLDPWNTVYYALPFLLALLAWEALSRPGRPPVLALAATAATWVTFEQVPAVAHPDVQCAVYLAWALPLAAWLAREAFAARTAAPARPLAPVARLLRHERA